MKPSGLVLRQQQREAAIRREARMFAIQQGLDMAIIALHTEFGYGPERCKKFRDAYQRAFMAYAENVDRDSRDDKDLWKTKEDVDRILREACGAYFAPWEERYGA